MFDLTSGLRALCPVILASFLVVDFRPSRAAEPPDRSESRKQFFQAIQERQAREKEEDRYKNQIWDDHHAAEDADNDKNYAEAVRLMSKAIEESKSFYGKDHGNVAWRTALLGQIYENWDKLDEAESCYKRAIVVYNSFDALSDRQHLAFPCDCLSGMVQGGHVFGDPAKWEAYQAWVKRRYPGESDRQALAEKLDYIREHTSQKHVLDPSWGSVVQPKDQAMDAYLSTVHENLKKAWHSPGIRPNRPAVFQIRIHPDYPDKSPSTYWDSESEAFDQAAAKCIADAQPFPSHPGKRVAITVEIVVDANGPRIPVLMLTE